jgi:chromosome segregation ATPase
MAQESNLGIKITIKGADQAVSTIKELKTAIQLAQQELEGMKRGTAEYDRLTKQVANANAAIKDFNKSVEGVTIEQQAEQFGKFAGGVTASFAAASAAVNLFGGDADRVSKAAVEAQNLLTIAISARAIAEGFAATKTIVLNTLTKTGTILNQGFTKSFKALTAAIAANPFGALVVAIGAVITAITLLNTKQTESEKQAKKAAEAQLQYAEAVKTAGLAASVTANQVGFLINELNLGNISLEDAEPLIRKFASGIKGISLETEEGRKTFNEYITALANFSQTQDKISAKQTELSEALKEGNTERARAIRNEITELTKNLARYQTTITNIENQSQQNEDAAAAREEARKKREEERLRRIQEELALRKEQLIAEEELTRAELLRYSKGQAAGELDIEQNLKERLKLIQESINKVRQEENVVTKFYKAKKTFSDAEIATLKQLGIQVAKEVKNLDNAGKSVDKIMEEIGFKDV